MRANKKIALVIIVTILALITADFILVKGYTRFFQPYFDKMDFVFKDTSYNDIIYIGNSRANFDINPYFIDSNCKTKSYNLGFGGGDIKQGLFFLRSYLEYHPTPKIILLTYDYRIFHLQQKSTLAPMFFYYTQHFLVREELTRFKYHATFLNLFPYLKYCFFTDYDRTCMIRGLAGENIGDGIKQYNIGKEKYDYRGFTNYQVNNFMNFKNENDSLPAIDSEAIKALDDLIKICTQNKIMLAFIYPPELLSLNSTPIHIRKLLVDSMIISLCKKNNFYHKRFDVPEFAKQDFADAIHLNIKGSQKYSIMLGNYLKSILQ